MNSLAKISTNLKKFLILICLCVFVFITFYYFKLDIKMEEDDFEEILKTKRKDNFQLKNNHYYDLNSKNVNDDKITKYLFCLIKTTPKALKNNKTLTTFKVWASRCSNYRFVTLIPDDLLNQTTNYNGHKEIQMPFYLLQPVGLKEEKYRKITDKLYSAMRYVYSRFVDYEWYLIADDDAYINMENMMEFLKARNSSAPATYGHDFSISVEGGFHSGGCGYLLTGEAYRRVGNKLVTNATYCQNTGIDDVDLAACLRTLGVRINSSLDELGRERFLPVNFLSMYIGPVPDWLNSYSAHKPQQGVNCCSDTIVGIHYMNPQQQIQLDVAFNMERYKINLLNSISKTKFNVTFKNVVDNYLLLVNQTQNFI